jgi:hypothetical protein
VLVGPFSLLSVWQPSFPCVTVLTRPRQLSFLQGNLEDLVGYEEDCSPQVLQVALREDDEEVPVS